SPRPASEPVRVDYGEELDLPAAGREPVRVEEAFASSAAAAEPARSLPEPIRSHPAARPAPALPRSVPAAVALGSPPEPESAGDETQTRQIVVPVKLPPGTRYEIVIRLQLDTTA